MATLDLRSAKRQKFIVTAASLSLAMGITILWPFNGWSLLPFLALTYLGTVWVLDFDLKGQEWAVLPLYSLILSVTTFWILHWIIEISWQTWSGVVLYTLAVYAILLTLNILNVATVRPLPLVRQALTVMSLAGTIGLFGLLYLTLSILPSIGEWIVVVTIVSWAISWPLIWASRLSASNTSRANSIGWSLLVALSGAELASILAFWPVSFMTSLVLAVAIIMIIGLIHYQQTRQLSKVIQRQYLLIGAIVTIVLYAVSSWT